MASPPILESHQPRDFNFPKREFGQKLVVKRGFQPGWFKRWSWLHYLEDNDSVLCFICMKANIEKKLQWSSSADAAFVTRGFSNWKDACVKFDNHQTSSCHKEAMLKVITLVSTTTDVAESLSVQHQQEKLERRQCFLKVLSNARFLARQGLPFRGHGDESDSNFLQLLKLRGVDDPRIGHWLKKKTDKYTSADVQNEILKTMAFHVLSDVADKIRLAPFFSVMVDETTDVSNKEQVVLCCRWVDESLEAHEDFVGLYQTESTEASVLLHIIQDVLRLNISITKLRGQCYDGASSMAGYKRGVAAQLLKEEPRAVFTHCYGHSLNLACSDTVKQCKLMRDALDVVHEITKLIKRSPRRDALLQRLKQQISLESSPGIRILCPTRWTVRANALQSILSNYEVLQILWDESLEFVKETEMRSRIMGVSTYMRSFDFFFGVLLGELLLRHSDNLSRTLQTPLMSASEGQKVAAMTVQALQSVRTEEYFKLFWAKAVRKGGELEVNEPSLPRRRKTPKRYDVGMEESNFPDDAEDRYRQIFNEALQLISVAIKSRFDQPGYKVYCKLEELLVKASKMDCFEEELEFICNFYKGDLNLEQLRMQLNVMASNIPKESADNLNSILQYLRELSGVQKCLLCEVCTLVQLILVMPATNAISERSFSSLRRVKTYLRSTMTQERLNSVMTLHIHKDLTDKLNLTEIGNEFVRSSEHRETLFGKFRASD